jgi:uncharacterized Rossmann fold enzyme
MSEVEMKVNPLLISIQDEVRQAFGWDLKDDLESACELISASEVNSNSVQERVQSQLNQSKKVIIIGAAASATELEHMIKENYCLIAADGAVGVLNELKNPEAAWNSLAAIVSDADGHPHLMQAINKKIPLFLHAHGDNKKVWIELLPYCNEIPLQITHQCPQQLDGAINPGGFTDGDRAICLALYLGIKPENIHLCGFTSNKIGRWTGNTNPEQKMKKLQWMDKIIQITGVEWEGSR